MKKSPESESAAILIFNDQSTLKLAKRGTIIGRDKGDIILSDPQISSSHCQIQYIEGCFEIFDMNSSNGTFVNDKKILRTKLNSNDKIRIGETHFKFLLQEESLVKKIPKLSQKRGFLDKTEKKTLINTLVQDAEKNRTVWNILIQVQYGNDDKEELVVSQEHIFIGRGSNFGNFEKDSAISRKHLMVKVNSQGEVFIEDQESINGTYLNSKKIHGIHFIKASDTIKIGSCTLKITAKASKLDKS